MDIVRDALLIQTAPVSGEGVTIAVLDTGVDPDHPDLREAVDLSGSKSFSLRTDIKDRHGHGTHVCGIIAGSGKASDGMYRGVAPGVRLLVFKVMEGQDGYDIDLPAGIAAALDAGADIINHSGGQRCSSRGPWKWPVSLGLRDRAFLEASEQGVLCVAAAGNEGCWDGETLPGTVIRPGNMPSMLCVGSTSDRTATADMSGRGPVYLDDRLRPNEVVPYMPGELGVAEQSQRKPDIVLPGEHTRTSNRSHAITSTRSIDALHVHPLDPMDVNDPYGRMAGTSQATAVASGMAALAIAYARQLRLDLSDNPGNAVMAILCKSAMRLNAGDARDFGHGFLLWPNIQAVIEDCASDEAKRHAVFNGPNLKLLA